MVNIFDRDFDFFFRVFDRSDGIMIYLCYLVMYHSLMYSFAPAGERTLCADLYRKGYLFLCRLLLFFVRRYTTFFCADLYKKG